MLCSRVLNDLSFAENKNLNLSKQRGGPTYQQGMCLVTVKWSFVPCLGFKNHKISKIKFLRLSRAKNVGKIAQVKAKVSPQAKH